MPLSLWVSSSLIQLLPKELMYSIGSNLNFVLLAHLKPRETWHFLLFTSLALNYQKTPLVLLPVVV